MESSQSLSRLSLIDGHLFNQENADKKPQPKPEFTDCWNYFRMNELITEKGRTFKDNLGKYLESIQPKLLEYYEKAEFPFFVVDEIKKIGGCGLDAKGYGSPELRIADAGAIFYELARWDASIATFMIVQNCLGLSVVEKCGNEEQKQRILPDCIQLKKLICFGLTEPTHGSDATSLLSTAKKTGDGYIINGKKRWIGNAGFADYIIVWARNVDEGNKIQGFLVEKGSKGLSTQKIENKYALRMVQNFDINLENVFVPNHNRLANALDFATGANNILKHSRIYVAWLAVGVAAGAFEAAYKYTMQRKQFGKEIAGFQLIQEKLQRMLVEINSMILLCHRVSTLYQRDKASMGQIAMTKAYCTHLAREVCQLAREVEGGNGIILQNHVMKQLMDMEAVHSYEGTYEVNALIAAREITGKSAFK